MTAGKIDRFVYRQMATRPLVARALDGVGRGINRVLGPLGVSYDTGARRAEAVLKVSQNPLERRDAIDRLIVLGRTVAGELARKAPWEKPWELLDADHPSKAPFILAFREFGIPPESTSWLLRALEEPPQDSAVAANAVQEICDTIAALRDTGFTHTGEYRGDDPLVGALFHVLRRGYGSQEKSLWTRFAGMPAALRALHDGGLNPTEIDRLLDDLSYSQRERIAKAFVVILELRAQGMSGRDIVALHEAVWEGHLAEGGYPHQRVDRPQWNISFEAVSRDLRRLTDTGFSREEALGFVMGMARRTTSFLSATDLAVELRKKSLSVAETNNAVDRVMDVANQNYYAALSLAKDFIMRGSTLDETVSAIDYLATNATERDLLAVLGLLERCGASPAEALFYIGSVHEMDIPQAVKDALVQNVEQVTFKKRTMREIASFTSSLVPLAMGGHSLQAVLELWNTEIPHEQVQEFVHSSLLLGWNSRGAQVLRLQFLLARFELGDKLFQLAQELGVGTDAVTHFLNDPESPHDIVERVVQFASYLVRRMWQGVLGDRGPEELPRVFKFCASVMAEKALFVYDKINQIATQTKKPTITVYVLSTAYKLNVERLADQFLERGLTRAETAAQLRAFRREVREKTAQGMPILEARLAVGREWLERGLFTRFTQPVYLKIPSGSEPAETVVNRLNELRDLCERGNYDMVFVDHSTVRSPEVVHAGDPVDFEKGRALARGLAIVDPSRNRRAWVTKLNDWGIPDISRDQPNFVALNLYDGRVYESHTGGHKSEWLPIDDNGEFIGRSWDSAGNERRSDYLIITKNGGGQYRAYSAATVFEQEFRAKIREIRGPKEKIRIPHRNILMVCNANHDRSSLLQYLASQMVAERVEDGEQVHVSSAGLAVNEWMENEGTKKEHPLFPSSGTRKLLDARRVDYRNFRKRQITAQMVAEAGIIFVMTRRQKAVLVERFPEAASKVHILREYAGFDPQDIDFPTPKTFDPHLRYSLEETLARIFQRMNGETLAPVRSLPKRAFRGRVYSEAA